MINCKKGLLLFLWLCGLFQVALHGQATTQVSLTEYIQSVAKHYDIDIIFDASQITSSTEVQLVHSGNAETDLRSALDKSNYYFDKIDEDSYVIKVVRQDQDRQSSRQMISIRGKVLDEANDEGLIGAEIVVKNNMAIGTTTDVDGNFELDFPTASKIQVSYLGYLSRDIDVSESQSDLVIRLKANTRLIDEVVVIGYGSAKKSDLTGAVSSVGEEELKQLPVTGLEQALQGRAAGVFITQNSGSPGGAMSVRIRGTGSTLSAEPLYVIDGIPIINDNAGTSATFESDGGGQYSSALTTINPNDIESIEVLKDASATAIYGARAANGVVMITTKKGSADKQTASYESYYGIQQLASRIPVMNLREYAEYIGDVNIGEIEEFENLDLLGEGTDWQDVIFRDAMMYNHQLTFAGGSQKTRYSFSGGLHRRDGIVQGSRFDRYSGKMSIDHSYNDRIRLGINVLGSRTKENITFNDNSNGVIYTALLTPPMVPARTLTGEFGTPPAGENVVLTFNNPLANALEVDDVNRKTRLLASVYGEVDITDWLSYRAEFATDLLYSNHNTFWPAFERGTQSQKSRVRRNVNNNNFWITKHLLTFKKQAGDHGLRFLAGFEAQEGKYEWLFASRDNLPNNELREINLGDAGTQQNLGGAGHWALLSYLGRLNYNYKDRYLLTSTLRADGSSRFGAENRFGLFPSVAFAWRISQEPFLEGFDDLYNLKLRLGYGAVGNQEIGLYSFAANLRSINVVIGDQLISGFGPDNIANPGVQWESSVQLNAGLDLGLWDNRVELVIDLYNKISSDMLVPAILPATAGGLNAPFINIGEMHNRGLEISVNTQNSVGKLDWRTSANISFNRNEVVDLGSTGALIGVLQRLPVTRTEEGMPIGQYFGFKTDGIFTSVDEIAESPFQEVGTRPGDIKFQDLNEDGVIDDTDMTFIGSPHPDFTFNLINDVSWKNFDLSIFFRAVYGNEVYNMLRRDLAGTGAWHNQSVDIIDRWTPSNPDGSEPRSNGNDPNGNRRVSDRFVEDGSYIRLQNVSLGYRLPKSLMSKIKISEARLYVSGQNLFTLTKYSGYDPEIGSFNQNPLINGVDNGRFPVARSITFGLNVNF